MLKKKILLGMLALGSCIAGITQAGNLETIGELPFSYTYNNSNFTVDEKLNFGDITDGVGKIQLPGSSYDWRYFYWREDGQIYTIGILQNNRIRAQGFISGFAIFDTEPTYIQIANSPKNIPMEDFYNGDYGTNFSQIKIKCNVNAYECGMCFKNEENKYICFYSIDNRNLKDSKGYTYTNEQLIIDNVVGEESPFEGGGGGNNYIKLPMCYTIQQKIDTFPSNYNTGMCYSTNKIWSGNQFITVTPKSMLELWPTYQEYEDDVNLYQNYCGNYVANNTTCGEAFSGKEDKRSIINKLYNQGTQTILRSYDYCYLQLSFTEEQKNTRTNCTMGTGLQHGSGITTNDIIEDMENHKITIIAPDGTTVYSGFWNNEDVEQDANLSYDGIIETMQSVRGKLTNIFYYRSGVTGIIPDYITRILLLIVLFAIFKK